MASGFDKKLVAKVKCGTPNRPRKFALDTGVSLGAGPRYMLSDDTLAAERAKAGWTIEYSLEWQKQDDEPDYTPVAFRSLEAYEKYLTSARANYLRSTAPQRVV